MNNDVKDIITLLIIPILTSALSFLGAMLKTNSDIAKTKEEYIGKIETVKIECRNKIDSIKAESNKEIEAIKADMEAQSRLYESNKKTDFVYKIVDKLMNSSSVRKELQQQLSDELKTHKGMFKTAFDELS